MTRTKRLTLLACAGLIALACSPEVRYAVDHQRDMDGAWHDEQGLVHLDATKDTLTIKFQERTFVFPDYAKFRGNFSETDVRLYGEGIRIDLTVETLLIREEGEERRRIERRIAELPKDKKITYVDGALLME